MNKNKFDKIEFEIFFNSYIETLLWSTSGNDNQNNFIENFDNYSIADFSVSSIKSIKEDCKIFINQNYDMINHNLSLAAHNFLLSRNGHGTGFFDSIEFNDNNDLLQKISSNYKPTYLEFNDNNKLEYIFM